jgi:hypothetical protein
VTCEECGRDKPVTYHNTAQSKRYVCGPSLRGALYRHVRSEEQLLDLVVDGVLAEIDCHPGHALPNSASAGPIIWVTARSRA